MMYSAKSFEKKMDTNVCLLDDFKKNKWKFLCFTYFLNWNYNKCNLTLVCLIKITCFFNPKLAFNVSIYLRCYTIR